MTNEALEAFLARLLLDEQLRRAALDDPSRLPEAERAVLATLDRDGLELAARSLAHKRRR